MKHRKALQLLALSTSPSPLKVSLAILIAVCSLVFGCAKPEQLLVEEPPAPQPQQQQAAEQPKPEDLAKLPPPEREEVQDKINKIFKGSAQIDEGRNPYFFVGDFNGDISQDIAIVVKPARGKLAEINNEFAAWISHDALLGVLPDPVVRTQSSSTSGRRVQMHENELLLAVIHGYGAVGWRDAEAQQTYLVKNAISTDMRAESWKNVLTRNKKREQLPRFHGDVIAGNLGGDAGFLYYDGAYYYWHDSRHRRLPPAPGVVHGGGPKAMR